MKIYQENKEKIEDYLFIITVLIFVISTIANAPYKTCGQADFLTTSACGGSACIVGVSRDCGHGIFRLEG